MATISEFLRTGQLGPVTLGLESNVIMKECGDPDAISRKSNPLIFRYGPIHFTFSRGSTTRQFRLVDIAVLVDERVQELKGKLRFEDFSIWPSPTRQAFSDFLDRIEYPPILERDEDLQFPSGVTAEFTQQRLSALRFARKEQRVRPSTRVSIDREPSLEQIEDMMSEAKRAHRANAPRAALLIAWAATEALLRRMALRQLEGHIDPQPNMLVRRLADAGVIGKRELFLLERIRQMRLASAHGLSLPWDDALLRSLFSITEEFLSLARTGQSDESA
ncbi:hypothetical protein R0290_21125 [Burkholderia semiarida]|uniref:hypothetical protein n=1 Tax=Burkholderia TaxID=32008 RepID=UPI001CF5D2F9|nr:MULTISPECIES: hypothetical protein [Burkholderia]MCA8300853.1 hypothetical protein [Burkholderia seminalis]MDN7698615.1 hypothetical protein [Burkholderia sp. AU44665]